jgi:hypothetical protein
MNFLFPKKDFLKPILQVEALVLFLASLYLYHHLGSAWALFPIFFLLPDLAFIGYLFGKRVGTICYNITHSEIGPVLIGVMGLVVGCPYTIALAIGWFSHINFDRMIGCGLKYFAGGTHLGNGPFKK